MKRPNIVLTTFGLLCLGLAFCRVFDLRHKEAKALPRFVMSNNKILTTTTDLHVAWGHKYAQISRSGELTLYANDDESAYAVVHPDGRVEYVNGCTPDQAAEAMWRAFEYMYAQHIHELIKNTNL